MRLPASKWVLVSLSTLSRLQLWLFAAAVVAATVAVMWRYRREPQGHWLLLLRALGGLLLLALLLEPALVRRSPRKDKARLAVVVDRSKSMRLPADARHSRIEAARVVLQQATPSLQALGDRLVPEWHDLDGPLHEGALDEAPNGAQTNLLGALRKVADAPNALPLGAVVLISDGADHGALAAAGDDDALLRKQIAGMAVPINTVAVAPQDAVADVALLHVDYASFAYVHNTFDIETNLRMTGLATQQVEVSLWREGKAVTMQRVVLEPGKTATVRFSDRPDKVGPAAYSVVVAQVPGDLLPHNNQQHFVVQVVRDKTRVLQVAGRPSWDERFLRQYLRRNPNVDLISFFILRTPDDDMSISEQELSLIPFPVAKLFTTELASFDLVVFQNFDFRLYQMQAYLQNIRDAVQKGLGFVMVGGSDSFAEGGYVDTPIENILPMRLPRAPQTGLVMQPLAPMLSDAAEHHPLGDLTLGHDNPRVAWESLPTLRGANRIDGLTPGATLLVSDAHLRDGRGAPMPLIAAMEAGAGRSVAIATDSTWRWRFHKNDGGNGERAYERFWSNVLRFLVRDPEHERVRIEPTQHSFEPDAEVSLHLSALDRDYKPVPYARVRMAVRQAGSDAGVPRSLTTGKDGELVESVGRLAEGVYRAAATAYAGSDKIGSGSAAFVVQSTNPEWRDAQARPDLLRKLAQYSGGETLPASGRAWEKLASRDNDAVVLDRRQTIELWDNGIIFILALSIWGGEWALRRRRGLA